jgi:hypothetical protein
VQRLGWLLTLVHWTIIVHLAIEVVYAGYMVFAVLRPPGVAGPLGAAAASVPLELMVPRRLYALEHWVAFVGLALYLALTEVLPRRLAALRAPESR